MHKDRRMQCLSCCCRRFHCMACRRVCYEEPAASVAVTSTWAVQKREAVCIHWQLQQSRLDEFDILGGLSLTYDSGGSALCWQCRTMCGNPGHLLRFHPRVCVDEGHQRLQVQSMPVVRDRNLHQAGSRAASSLLLAAPTVCLQQGKVTCDLLQSHRSLGELSVGQSPPGWFAWTGRPRDSTCRTITRTIIACNNS